MGSKSRKRRQVAKQYERVVARMGESETPIMVAIQALGDARMPAKAPYKPKARHVLAKESSGHQHIGGSRALSVMLTPEDRQLNRQIHKERPSRRLTESGVPNDVKGDPAVGKRLVSGVEFDPAERKSLHRVKRTTVKR